MFSLGRNEEVCYRADCGFFKTHSLSFVRGFFWGGERRTNVFFLLVEVNLGPPKKIEIFFLSLTQFGKVEFSAPLKHTKREYVS